jgi:hypothetical protein
MKRIKVFPKIPQNGSVGNGGPNHHRCAPLGHVGSELIKVVEWMMQTLGRRTARADAISPAQGTTGDGSLDACPLWILNAIISGPVRKYGDVSSVL